MLRSFCFYPKNNGKWIIQYFLIILLFPKTTNLSLYTANYAILHMYSNHHSFPLIQILLVFQVKFKSYVLQDYFLITSV